MIREFFVVTASMSSTSVYHLKDRDPEAHGGPSAEKIALKGKSPVLLGEKIREGSMVAIAKQLTFYSPNGGNGFQRKIEGVITRYKFRSTSQIVALFGRKEEAMLCFESQLLIPSDPRWSASTRKILWQIGHKHPVFYIAESEEHALIRGFPPRSTA